MPSGDWRHPFGFDGWGNDNSPSPEKNGSHRAMNIFFDLDGTLSDPREGITGCIQYALKKLKQPYPGKFNPAEFIGPPLRSIFMRLLSSDDRDLIEKAVAFYRERFSETGLYENQVYPGIIELLAALHANSNRLFVVTSKPKIYAERIVRHFALGRWFEDVFGPELDGRFDDKTALVEWILHSLALRPEKTVMIGDRKEDVQAGKTNGTRTIGVTYGFGSKEEIISAAPDYVCQRPAQIQPSVSDMKSKIHANLFLRQPTTNNDQQTA
jgi:phosphoglycolate phosphatase